MPEKPQIHKELLFHHPLDRGPQEDAFPLIPSPLFHIPSQSWIYKSRQRKINKEKGKEAKKKKKEPLN